MLTKIMAYICFWSLFTVGAITTLYALFMVGYRGYQKIRDLISNKKLERQIRKNSK